jgi:endonuclease/exonuclease/phosphatase (EEP) superfamily protein YafD
MTLNLWATGDYSCDAVIAEVLAPEPLGRLLVVSHGPSWPWWAEVERELQALAVVRRIQELVSEDPAHVVVGGDFNAEPTASSVRFWTGRQSLDGTSTAYRDCWERPRRRPRAALRPAEPADPPRRTRPRPLSGAPVHQGRPKLAAMPCSADS